MYYLTGLPGFIRFGYSPGWSGSGYRAPGSCAQYLAETGQLANAITAMTARARAPLTVPIDPQQRLQILKANYEALKTQLENLKKEIDRLELSEKGGQ